MTQHKPWILWGCTLILLLTFMGIEPARTWAIYWLLRSGSTLITVTADGLGITLATDCSAVVTLGAPCFDTDDFIFYIGNGTTAELIGPGATPTLDGVMDAGNDANGATSTSTAMGIGGSTSRILIYQDGTGAPRIRASNAARTTFYSFDRSAESGDDPGFINQEATTCYTEDSVTGLKTYTGTSNCGLPTRTLPVPAGAMTISGTCGDTAPQEETIVASGPKLYTIEPADNDTCSVEFDFDTPPNWNAGTITIMMVAQSNGNNSTEVLELDFAGKCVRGNDAVTAHATTGERAATCTFGNQAEDEQHCTTAAITLQGTCAAGAHVYMRGQVDATATTLSPITDGRILSAVVTLSVTRD